MTITLRSEKTNALTFSEMDGNFSTLDGRLLEIESSYAVTVNNRSGTIVLTTNEIAEGATNQYYTQARFNDDFDLKTTDNLTEGSTNVYWTQNRFNTAFGEKTTTNLTEGANLYYTNARADARIGIASIGDLMDVDTTGITDEHVLTWNGFTSRWEPAVAPGAAGGETNVGASVGGFAEVYQDKFSTELRFRTLQSSDSTVTITQNTDDIDLTVPEVDGGTF